MPKLRLLVVDDRAVSIEGLKNLLSTEDDAKLSPRREIGGPAVKKVSEVDLDICIMDVSRPGLDGALATRRMKQTNPAIKVIALADDHDLHRLERLLGSGINAYILKRRAGLELIDAIRAVVASGVFSR